VDRHGICTQHGLIPHKEVYTHPRTGEKKCRICAREYMRRWKVPRTIPGERLSPVLKHHMENVADGHGVETLAVRAGVSSSTIVKIMSGLTGTVRLDTADRLLCAIGRVELWFVSEAEADGGLAWKEAA
jgi:transcriptional regulator with XRE-family HTH domain